jgi:hypothetical protein
MRRAFAAAALAFAAWAAIASCARADDAAAPPALEEMTPSRAAPGWARQATSLLLYGDDGSLSAEIPLRAPDASGTTSRETLGGVSPDARVAWTLERKVVWSAGRTKILESRRAFKTYGTSGAELWHDDAVDLPERGDPVLFSADGKTLLLARRTEAGWIVEARTWLGQPIASVGPFPGLISMAFTPGGRFALARWTVPDKSDTHTFFDLATKARRDVSSSDLVLGLARIGDDGVVRSGLKTVFAFDVASSTDAAPAPAVSTSAAVPPAVSTPSPTETAPPR